MTQKLVIMDDELGGKSKREAKRLKELTSKQEFTLREPYGRKNVTLKRMACLCGTSNEDEVLNDPTGNRRIIPIRVLSIDFEKYNSINKTDLFLEAFKLWKEGERPDLSREHIQLLNSNTIEYEQINIEKDLINQFFSSEPIEGAPLEFMTATQIKIYLQEQTGEKLNGFKIGSELKSSGFVQQILKIGGKTSRVYPVYKVDQNDRNKIIKNAYERETKKRGDGSSIEPDFGNDYVPF